jgi:hypothetical protein
MRYEGFYYYIKTPVKLLRGKKVRDEKYKEEYIIFLVFAVHQQEERNRGNELEHIIVAPVTEIA